jgi:type IV pilus assembly protein PilB
MAIDFTETAEDSLAENDGDSEAIKRLVHLIILEAVQLRATEICIEPLKDRIRVQYGIEGKLVERDTPPLRLLDAIVDRIKTLAEMDGADEGRIALTLGEKEVLLDVKISSSTYGESVRMRFVEDLPKVREQTRDRFWA